MQITSKTNAKVKKWVKYHQKKYRMQDQRYLIEGLHLLEEAKMPAYWKRSLWNLVIRCLLRAMRCMK